MILVVSILDVKEFDLGTACIPKKSGSIPHIHESGCGMTGLLAFGDCSTHTDCQRRCPEKRANVRIQPSSIRSEILANAMVVKETDTRGDFT